MDTINKQKRLSKYCGDRDGRPNTVNKLWRVTSSDVANSLYLPCVYFAQDAYTERVTRHTGAANPSY
jgi:hypothetical protein